LAKPLSLGAKNWQLEHQQWSEHKGR